MSTYLKFIMVAALFVTTTITSMFETAPTNASATPSQTTLKDGSRKAKKATESTSTSTTKIAVDQTTTSSSDVVEDAISSKTPDPVPAATDASAISSAVAQEETVDSVENETPYEVVVEEGQTTTSETIIFAEEPVAEVENPAPAPTVIQPNQLKINGQMISYSNAGQASGQAIIDANHNQVATWGGAAVQSGTDGANQVTSYTVTQIVTVDDSGMAADGTDYWNQITGTGGGERITLQTCINDDYNLILFASK
ncbi:sortase [Enterococcus pseudoavium]|uniref:hypothetical protein n=1 Tax=Enterococcus pseudoavium TaxID=44007 RepID=UPI0009F827CE|nr:hypothetical protein [Enterococcus pseudoavium]